MMWQVAIRGAQGEITMIHCVKRTNAGIKLQQRGGEKGGNMTEKGPFCDQRRHSGFAQQHRRMTAGGSRREKGGE